MSEHQSYIRIMSDIFESGIWAKLSSASKTLYPVLLKFSDYNFKPVWPNTETLLRLTGFKTKKSIVEAKRDLEKNGLIHSISGSGRKSTHFYFRFDYPGSKITPLGDTNIPARRSQEYPSGGTENLLGRGMDGNPNHINITIHNNQNKETKKEKKHESEIYKKEKQGKTGFSLETVLEDFGPDVFHYAYREAEKRGLKENLPYIKTVCRNRIETLQKSIKNEQFTANEEGYSPSWKGFLEWVEYKLTPSSSREFRKMEVSLDGSLLYIHSPVTAMQKNIMESFFAKDAESEIALVFASPKLENRIF
jgi:hypothetical protein